MFMRKFLVAFLIILTPLILSTSSARALDPGGKCSPVGMSSANGRYKCLKNSNGVGVWIDQTSPSGPTSRGGSYQLGQIGPGGGNVFYISKGGFPCGPTLQNGCHYLEAAPTIGKYAWRDVAVAWSGNTTQTSGATDGSIGMGFKNTLKMLKMKHAGTRGAGSIARAYRGGNKTDWYLPAIDELYELYSNTSAVGGPMKDDYYWASSVSGTPGFADCIDFSSYHGPYSCPTNLTDRVHVRPIRAF